jgi:hypothetical protein
MRENAELWSKLRPFAMLDIEQLATKVKQTYSSESEGEITLYGSKVRHYTADEDGLRGAISAAEEYDTILIPPVQIELASTLTIDQKIRLIGLHAPARNLSADTYHHGAIIKNGSGLESGSLISVSVSYVAFDSLGLVFSGNSSSSITVVNLSSTGCSLRDVLVYGKNLGTGNVCGISAGYTLVLSRVYAFASAKDGVAYGLTLGPMSSTTLYADLCYFEGESETSLGYGCVVYNCTAGINQCGFNGNTYGLFLATPGGG